MFYNLRVGRPQVVVTREIHALLADNPAVLGFCEAEGYIFPEVEGYKLLRNRKNGGRRNVAAYVRKGLSLAKVRWHDMKETWNRTEHPGVHEARSWVSFRLDGVLIVIGHQPPKYTNNTLKAQQEGLEFLTKKMAPWTVPAVWRFVRFRFRAHELARGRLVMADFNRGPQEDGPGPKELAKRCKGAVHGKHIDCAVTRGMVVYKVEDFTDINGVHLGTDHPWGATRFVAEPNAWK